MMYMQKKPSDCSRRITVLIITSWSDLQKVLLLTSVLYILGKFTGVVSEAAQYTAVLA